MIGYLVAIPFLLTTIYYFLQKKIIGQLIHFFNYLFIVIYSLTAVGEACLYREWKSKLSMQALQHFLHPSEVFKTTSLGLTFLFFGLSAIFIFLFIKLYNRKISLQLVVPLNVESFLKRSWKGLLYFVVVIVFSGLSIRGGLQQIPIQSSDAFFCTQPIANDVAVNPFGTLFIILLTTKTISRKILLKILLKQMPIN
ncbi:MAG: hypothetical protein IPH89_15270 [Bacteroidetes bacterium]|nr:hypothetical protein [Bacteroidota bacterium]